MKIVTVVGARPQFIKSGIVSKKLRKVHKEILIHTGQHYDYNLSDVIFADLDMPTPDYNLEVGSGTHGKQTGRMLEKIEAVLLTEKPDMTIVYGDTNSTIAGALAASKLHIPILHVEAGLRSLNMRMPEEQNRILTDHISSLYSCPTETAVENLKREGITRNVYNTGDVMYDAAVYIEKIASKKSLILEKLGLITSGYTLVTIHRAENTDNSECMQEIFSGLSQLTGSVIIPLHPRTKKIIRELGIKADNKNIKIIEPVSYIDMIQLESNSRLIITDSGGVQKEAFFFKKPCITLRNETEWVETLENGWNQIAGANSDKLMAAVDNINRRRFDEIPQGNYYGDGYAVDKIIRIMEEFI